MDFSNYLFHKHNIDRMAVDKAVFGDTITAADSQKEVDSFEKYNPEFIKYANEIYNYTRNLQKFSLDAGVMSQESYDYNIKTYPHYVPTYRVGKSVGKRATIRGVANINKKAKGSNLDLLPILTTLEKLTIQRVSNAKN